jgi:FKBP-type peptidyl-prolyl cis-trans isomerase
MNKRVIWVVALGVLLIGGFFIYSFMNNQTPTPPGENTAGASPEQVQAQDITVGTGTEATPGAKVSVLYVGRFEDGTVFDSSEAHGNEPLVFVLGEPGLIPGFQIGVNGMKEGGERVIGIPPTLAYGVEGVKGQDGTVVIPPNTTIYFSLKLVKVEKATTTTAQ